MKRNDSERAGVVETPGIGHVAISASAGSGKTYQLSNRFVGLLMKGVPVDRIVALTFSRKAAGEIFDMIMERLTDAAASADAAEKLGNAVGVAGCDPAQALLHLRAILIQMHRLHISTIDSFTLGIVRSFPMELGVSPEIEVMDGDGAAARAARRDVLQEIFSRRHVSRADQEEFLTAFHLATFGHEDKSIDQTFDRVLSTYQALVQALPDAEAWGDARTIWPDGSPWLEPLPQDAASYGDAFRAWMKSSTWPETVQKRWLDFVDSAVSFQPGSAWDFGSNLIDKLLPAVPDIRGGEAEVKSGQTRCALDRDGCSAILGLIHAVVQTQIGTAVQQTQGLYRVLRLFESVYDERVRRRGQLTFDDAQYLLTEMNPRWPGLRLTSDRHTTDRLYIEYRLDHRLDHWLIDEFQDTSNLQWGVLRNLIDEVIQDPEGTRSFFYVGDVKQAIYGWRGGNAQLFRRIQDHYGDAIGEKPLDRSFRSCKAVIDTVNQVFDALPRDQLKPGAVDAWEDIWSPHAFEPDVVPGEGCVALIEPPCDGGDTKPTREDRFQAVADLLREVDPLNRGLSVAVLVLRNSVGRAMVDFIREACPDIPVTHEGQSSIKDNPVVAVLLSLVRVAAHPGDTLAASHIRMSPLASVFRERGIAVADASEHLLRDIHEHGFRGMIQSWGSALCDTGAIDAFGRRRWQDLVAAAGEFDATGDRSCDQFLEFIDHYGLHESAAEDSVRVMTVHQSKGLGFDVVILPDLNGAAVGGAYSTQGGGSVEHVVSRDLEGRTAPWVLRMPNRTVSSCDAVLARELRIHDEANSFDALCRLYVAMTRAKRAMYLVTSFAGSKSTMKDFAALLKGQLAGSAQPTTGADLDLGGSRYTCLFQSGALDWFHRCPPAPSATPVPPAEPAGRRVERRGKRIALATVSPSGLEHAERNAGDLFALARRERFDFGTAIHELFEQVSWIDDVDAQAILRQWIEDHRHGSAFVQRVSDHFLHAVQSPMLQDCLRRPSGDVALWRERRFEVILNRDWVTGVFDRVVIENDRGARPIRATILDYKTDHVESENDMASTGETYRAQLVTYRAALSRYLDLDEEKIGLFLVFTGPGLVYEIDG